MLQQVQKINTLASKELVKGFWDMKVSGDLIGWVYVEDGREAFVNAVKMLKEGVVGNDDVEIEKLLAEFKTRNASVNPDTLSDIERENAILDKLETYNKIYVILLKKLRLQYQTQTVYVERYK
jgi:hypothetical protein